MPDSQPRPLSDADLSFLQFLVYTLVNFDDATFKRRRLELLENGATPMVEVQCVEHNTEARLLQLSALDAQPFSVEERRRAKSGSPKADILVTMHVDLGGAAQAVPIVVKHEERAAALRMGVSVPAGSCFVWDDQQPSS